MYFEKMFFSRFFCGEKDLFAKFAHAELRPDELLKRVFQIVQPDDGVPIALRQMKLQPQHLFRKRRITVDLLRNRIAESELLPVRFHLKTELADQMISVTVFRPEEIEIKNSGDGSLFGSCPESYGRRFPRERRKITGNYCNHVSRFSFHTQAPDTAEEARGIRDGNPVGELPMTGPESGAVFELSLGQKIGAKVGNLFKLNVANGDAGAASARQRNVRRRDRRADRIFRSELFRPILQTGDRHDPGGVPPVAAAKQFVLRKLTGTYFFRRK